MFSKYFHNCPTRVPFCPSICKQCSVGEIFPQQLMLLTSRSACSATPLQSLHRFKLFNCDCFLPTLLYDQEFKHGDTETYTEVVSHITCGLLEKLIRSFENQGDKPCVSWWLGSVFWREPQLPLLGWPTFSFWNNEKLLLVLAAYFHILIDFGVYLNIFQQILV